MIGILLVNGLLDRSSIGPYKILCRLKENVLTIYIRGNQKCYQLDI